MNNGSKLKKVENNESNDLYLILPNCTSLYCHFNIPDSEIMTGTFSYVKRWYIRISINTLLGLIISQAILQIATKSQINDSFQPFPTAFVQHSIQIQFIPNLFISHNLKLIFAWTVINCRMWFYLAHKNAARRLLRVIYFQSRLGMAQ